MSQALSVKDHPYEVFVRSMFIARFSNHKTAVDTAYFNGPFAEIFGPDDYYLDFSDIRSEFSRIHSERKREAAA